LNDNLKKAKLLVDGYIKEFDRKLLDVFTIKSSIDKLISS